MDTMSTQGQQKIAIVGSGCRFPGGANTPSKLWELLREPPHLAESIPQDRFSISGFYHPNGQYHGHSNVKKAYFLEGKGAHRRFDAAFFGINRVEANVMDPQARLLMETVYEALEAAGQTIDNLRGSTTAVYAGQMVADYEQVMVRDNDTMGTYHATGTSRALLANRISYFYDWHGPSETIDTACSSSLVAIHHAVQQLRSGQSRVAIAAGANLIFDPQCFAAESTLNMLSPDGQSRMWDAGANGYGRGEGVAAVVLKTLSAAEEDGDHIECVIAETAVNHDGRTRGITMPNASAQAQLIRDCYARAGLDLTNPCHRPQYFEAHGTGTPAGDPVEAEAIAAAFFPQGKGADEEGRRLLVGSIKTVIGHTEGTAGLAGILKTSLAMQNSLIPPNLLFQELSPSVRPFYKNLHLVTTPQPWPEVAKDMPRRSSVNSFGFGGTNAHAILESYAGKESSRTQPSFCFTPFVFSAASEASLRSYMITFSKFLKENETNINIQDLAYTLYSRRTRIPYARSVAALTVDDLHGKIDMIAHEDQADPNSSLKAQAANKAETAKILGIFTGQGAQWARMGLELIQESPVARKIINDLDFRLSQLPIPPSWSILEEIERDGQSSRINEAAVSQTICTAVQILQVRLLSAAGVRLSAVVGHSSGEIAAAYAAGLVSSRDAICIAYYRGLHSHLARGPDGQTGSMMAVGTTAEDAQELCDEPEYTGHVHVAAINAPESVTLSGDRDAIQGMKVVFDDEGKSARILHVDVAYHSHHLKEVSDYYLDSLLGLNIQIRSNLRSPWFSSVYGRLMCGDSDPLKASYWVTNMMSPVLYMQAIQSALSTEGPFAMAIELGPHPALKGPTLQILRQTDFRSIPYASVLSRGTSALVSSAEGLGQVWVHAGPSAISLRGYDKFLSGGSTRNLVKGLPSYAWNHEKEYWHESRYARAIRMREGPVNEILGHITPDSTHQDRRWRHILCPAEMPWLRGHQLQGQIVFPAAAYVVLALESTLALCHGSSATLIEVEDVEIGKALSFDLDETRVETILSVTDIRPQGTSKIEARFNYSAEPRTSSSNQFDLLASGRVRVTLGGSTDNALSAGPPRSPSLLDVNDEEFYESMRDLEYEYSGPFASLHGLQRKLGAVTGFVRNLEPSALLIHPGILDAAFQSAFLVYCAPGDGGLDRMHVPRRIRKISVNPDLCAREVSKRTPVPFSSMRSPDADFRAMTSDIHLHSTDVGNSIIQVEGLQCVPLSSAAAQDDKEVFSKLLWDAASPNAEAVSPSFSISAKQRDVASLLERMAIFYLRALERGLPVGHPARLGGPYASWFRFASHCTAMAQGGHFALWTSDWENDTMDQLASAIEPHSDVIDVMILRAVGDNIVGIAAGEASAVDICMRNDMLSKFYLNGIGLEPYTKSLARIIKQIVHRYPHMDILEVGAGTGACTQAVLSEIGSAFSSYTFTDISTSFFDSARSLQSDCQNQMVFRALDICQSPSKQGFQDHAYDVVVASLVLHATPNLEETLRNTRCLLKPGGYLVAFELLPAKISYLGVIFGAFPGWWLGANEGRVLTPAVSLEEWDSLLRKAGFSGCDSNTNLLDELIMPGAIFVSQALDDRVTFIRDPFSAAPTKFIQDLVILGGDNPSAKDLSAGFEHFLGPYCGNVRRISSLNDVTGAGISPASTILSLASLDGLRLTQLDDQAWDALKVALLETGSLVWITHGRRAKNPHANAMIGLVRSVVRESSLLDYLFLDVESKKDLLDASAISSMILQHLAASQWRSQEDFYMAAEREVVLSNGQILIPRLVVSKGMNARYNSSRRAIFDETQKFVKNIGLSGSTLGYAVEEATLPRRNKMRMHVSHSVLSSLRCSDYGLMFLVLGLDCESGDHIVAFSAENNRVVCPWENVSAPVKPHTGSDTRLLALMAHHILVSDIVRGLDEGDKILVYDPDPNFAAVLSRIATPRGIDVTCIKHSNTAGPIDPRWSAVHTNATDRELFCIIPDRVSVYVDFSAHDDNATLGNRIRSWLPQHCRSETLDTLFSSNAVTPSVSRALDLQDRLCAALTWSFEYLQSPEGTRICASEVSIQQLAAPGSTIFAPATVVDWKLYAQTPVRLKSASTLVNFDPNRTYWLAGLSGGLGRSLSEWMVHRGAKHIIISSRSPRVGGSWLDDMRTLGAVLKISSCDLTNCEDVVALHAEITSTMPPIGGVVQGAMVLRDTPLRNMTLDNLLNVMQPKVQGSLCLSDLFQQPTLDFFIFLSSATSIIGNPGQANYTAANLFMSSLAAQRRNLGLAASVMHIGPIYGVGYISQQVSEGKTPFPKNHVRSGAYIPTSERDFHELFAEAVMAGSPDSAAPAEIVSGIRRVGTNEPIQPIWRPDPLMSHFIRRVHTAEQVEPTAKSNRVPIKTRLAEALDHGQVESIIREAFMTKIRTLFQREGDETHDQNLWDLRLDELGIDSLSAVEIRSWTMKNFEVNIPVLKILDGVTVGDLVALALERIPGHLIPRVGHVPPAEESESQQSFGRSSGETVTTGRDPSDTSYSSEVEERSEKPAISNSDETSNPVIQKSFRLSFSQDMFWFLWASLADKTSLNHTGWARLTGSLDIARLENAVRLVSQQHESLRTCFLVQDGKPVQAIMETSALRLEVQQIQSEHEVTQMSELLQKQVFDVERGNTMRLILLSLTPKTHSLVFGVHPLAFDGTSFQVFLTEVLSYYTDPTQRKDTRQYSVFSEKQHTDFEAGKFDAECDFWRNQFSTLPPPFPILSLSAATSRPPLTTFENEQAVLWISHETKSQVQATCRRLRVTPFHFYLAVFRTLLLRYAADAEDICIGCADKNRTDDQMMEVIGTFVNLLPLRFINKDSATFESLLQDARNKAYAALANSSLPFPALLTHLDVPRSSTYTPLFQCFIDYRVGQRTQGTWGDVELQFMDFKNLRMAYDVALDIVDEPNGHCVHIFEVQKDLYGRSGAERLAKSYEQLLKAFAVDPVQRLNEPTIFQQSEMDETFKFSQGPLIPSNWPRTVSERIDEVIESKPQSPAIQLAQGGIFTYGDISCHANAIAASLSARCIAHGTPVAVLQEPTQLWIASILGIFRHGSAYLPLDLSLPWARLKDMANDCRPGAVLVDQHTRHNVGELGAIPGMVVVDVSSLHGKDFLSPVQSRVTENSMAAVLYTSGSSGRPKGIMLTHRGLCNWAEHVPPMYGLKSEVVLQQTSSTFDVSLIQILTALTHGGVLCLVPRKLRGDASAIASIMARHNVTVTSATPTEYSYWIEHGGQALIRCEHWRTAFCIGEGIPATLPRKFCSLQREELRLINIYGPTEASLAASGMIVPCSPVPAGQTEPHSLEPIAAGRPLPNYSIHVLDAQLRPLPAGVQGEIYIGGSGVGLGYLGKPELTAEKFIRDVLKHPGGLTTGPGILHRSGDLGRWQEDGTLVVEGRIGGDTQIKLRGLRIDVSEVEDAIMAAAEGMLCHAAVTARKLSADSCPVLVAHVVFSQCCHQGDFDRHIRRIRSGLHGLPQYMHPALIVPVRDLPRTNAAKLDRKAVADLVLPGQEISLALNKPEAFTETEVGLQSLWHGVIGQAVGNSTNIRPETDFFQVGGTSLLLLALRARIAEAFDVRIPLIRMFDHSTLSSMACWIDNRRGQRQQPNDPTEADGVIDWDEETQLPSSLLAITSPQTTSNVGHAKVVVLTGATGHLGRGLLSALVQDPKIERVHCIGIRNTHARRDILEDDKVRIHEGDLNLPSLGLSEDNARRIFDEANAIIHNGADMSYLKTYASLRRCNVESTKELARLGAHRRIPFHFVSTVSVGHVVAETNEGDAERSPDPSEFIFRPVSVAAHPPAGKQAPGLGSSVTAHGYIASKWASECFLERLKERFPSWQVSIHRPSLIARGSGKTAGTAPGLELVQNMRHYSSLLHAVPAVSGGRVGGVFDLVQPETVVDGILKELLDHPEQDGEVAGVRFYHHTGGVELPLGDLRRWILEDKQYDRTSGTTFSEVEEIDLAEWTRRAASLGMHETIVSMLEEFVMGQGEINVPRVGK